jgi:shikimate kinase
MGSGKTTVGRLLAARLARRFVDGDEELERATGRTARQIAEADRVPALLVLEARVLLDALARPQPAVIAAAASVVDDARCRRALRSRDVTVVRLRARPDTLAARHAAGSHRRSLGVDPLAGFTAQVRIRERRFRAVEPAVTVDVDARDPGEIVGVVLRELGDGRGGGSGI